VVVELENASGVWIANFTMMHDGWPIMLEDFGGRHYYSREPPTRVSEAIGGPPLIWQRPQI
jgi:hypothetical protein